MKTLIPENISSRTAGTALVLIGIMGISESSVLGPLLLILSGLLTFPSIYQLVNSLLKNKISANLRTVLVLILFLFGTKVYLSDVSKNPVNLSEVLNNSGNLSGSTQPEISNLSSTDGLYNNIRVTVVSVTDGDTVRVMLNGNDVPVRLIGIDTPEISHPAEPIQCYGPEAKKALEELILNKEVVLEKDVSDKDKYDRYLRYIWLGDILINEYIVQNGYGFSSPYPPDTKYQARLDVGEQAAKSDLKGLWSKETCDGDVYTGTYKEKAAQVTDAYDTKVKSPEEAASPVVPNSAAPIIPVAAEIDKNSQDYTCNCKKTCSQMISCEEAQYQLNVCGCAARDGDRDGVACDSDCQ